MRKKSTENIDPMDHGSPTLTSSAPQTPIFRKKSTESMMVIDDDISSPTEGPFKLLPLENDDQPLTNKEFSYTMQIMDDKINSLYKLCRYISDQQETTSNSLKKLVALDE